MMRSGYDDRETATDSRTEPGGWNATVGSMGGNERAEYFAMAGAVRDV